MNDPTTKTCRMCAETIKAAARLCPYCRTDQRQSAVIVTIAPWLMGFLLLAFFVGGFSVVYRLFTPGRDFAPFRNQFEIVSSSMQFNQNEKGAWVATVGTIRNNSDYAWKEVQLEARYFDSAGKLIDVGVQTFSDVVVQQHSESAFRIRTIAGQPTNAYASHKVLVRSGRDIRQWP